MKTKKHYSLDRQMCTEHRKPKKNSNMELIQTLVLQSITSSTKECT